jgi:class 3 adenylate cyclase
VTRSPGFHVSPVDRLRTRGAELIRDRRIGQAVGEPLGVDLDAVDHMASIKRVAKPIQQPIDTVVGLARAHTYAGTRIRLNRTAPKCMVFSSGWPAGRRRGALRLRWVQKLPGNLVPPEPERMVSVVVPPASQGSRPPVLDVRLLGRFVVTGGGRSVGSWPRPSARRLCQLVLVSPGRKVSREVVCEALFPSLSLEAAARSLYKAQSMARLALKELGPEAAGLLRADPSQIWADQAVPLVVDLDVHEQALRAALHVLPGQARDAALVEVLSTGGVPLEDEPEAEWAAPVRERVEYLRQEARLELARDRSRGVGRAHPEAVLQAWQACLGADATDEEAAAALMQLYVAQGRRPYATAVYERCRGALAQLGMKTSPALEEVLATADDRRHWPSDGGSRVGPGAAAASPPGEERRLVSVVFVELAPAGFGGHADPEDLRELISAGLAETMTEVEAFGGTVASISGFGMSVLFGAPQSHEDDPERALRASLRIAAAVGQAAAKGNDPVGGGVGRAGPPPGGLSVRIGVESGTAVVGPIGDGDQMRYGAVGEAVGVAATLQSAAKPGTVLVGPSTRAAAEQIFEWGPNQDLPMSYGTPPLSASYLVGARPRSVAVAGRRGLAARASLVGRGSELAVLTGAVRVAAAGKGGAVVLTGEPGIGKTRLVSECRKFFMGWVGAASGRLPLWLEGRCASYASSIPYGAYQQLLSRFVGVPLESGEEVLRPALESAVRAVLGRDSDLLPVLAHMMGMATGADGAHLGRMGPAELQHVTFGAVRSLLSKFVSRGPTVLAIEDLHWSDPTSLRLTAELASLGCSDPLLVLVTRRPEPDPGVGELEAALGQSLGRRVRLLDLVALQRPDERALARLLLGGDVSVDVLEAVCEGADGNPLFLEERVASLLDTGVLQRDVAGWQLRPDSKAPLPDALERLIRSRTDRLSLPAREVMVAASVLGQENDRSALGAVSELDAELDDAVAEVVSAGLLVEVPGQPEPRYRFRHALIREATYGGLLRSQRRQLHARAAWDLETRAAGRLDEVAAVLGNHLAAAAQGERAAHYLELAGDRAARIFANDEAIALYRQALAVIGGDGKAVGAGQRGPGHAQTATALAVSQKLGRWLLLVDRFAAARAVVLDGIARAATLDPLWAARFHVLLGNLEYQDLRLSAADDALEVAEKLVGPCGLDDDQEHVNIWLAAQVAKARHALLGNEVERAGSILARVRPLAEARGSPVTVADFYSLVSRQHLRALRYRVDAAVVEEHRRAAKAAQAIEGTTSDLVYNPETIRFCAMMYLGEALTWYGDLYEAGQVLDQALTGAERAGSTNARSVILIELAVAAFRQGDVELVRELVPEARTAAAAGPRTGHNWNHVAAATVAFEAWVAWHDQRAEHAVTLGTEALELWKSELPSYQLRCLALFPLASAYLNLGQAEKAVDAARQTLEPTLAQMPDELEAAVHRACEAWDRGQPEKAGRLVGDAVTLAHELRYA